VLKAKQLEFDPPFEFSPLGSALPDLVPPPPPPPPMPMPAPSMGLPAAAAEADASSAAATGWPVEASGGDNDSDGGDGGAAGNAALLAPPPTPPRSSFSASIPKGEVISALGFGYENKVVTRFTYRFWARKPGQKSKTGDGYSHWQTRDQRFRFINGDALGKPGTIIAHVGPPFSVEYRDVAGKYYSDAEVVGEVCKCLQEMFALPAPPVPVDSHVTRWAQVSKGLSFCCASTVFSSKTAPFCAVCLAQDQLALGSYSFQKVHSGSDMCDALAAPEWGGRLCFAGEACCQDRVQCVDGALVTGQRAADTVAENQLAYEGFVRGSTMI
jgi:hypothetical protein